MKTLAIDLDGTLLDSRKTIGPLSLKMIARVQQAGWTVILSTARPRRAIRAVVPDWFADFYWAGCNGAWILQRGQILRRTELSAGSVTALLEALRPHNLHVMIEAEDRLYSNRPVPEEFVDGAGHLGDWAGNGACKVLVRLLSPEQADLVGRIQIAGCTCVITDSGSLAQIAHRDCNKLEAVKAILRREGGTLQDTIAFGDDNNDLPLVSAVGRGVAMGNATQALKQAARETTGSNDEDGVGMFLAAVLQE
ncbi:MAG: HAD family hydrolase [Anaerolineales bacterium]|nr:HAD family hydrolase [Anaerolineales bacterium]